METGSQPKVVVIDDNPTNLRLLREMLSSEGYSPRPFSNPQTGLKSCQTDPPDLIILDITMPAMDGFQVCARLKDHASTSKIPIVFISALTDSENIVKGFESGGVDYIVKPFQAEEVISRISTHLQLRKTEQLLESKNKSLEDTLLKLKAAQAQLIHSEKMASLGILTAGVAHEINNPLNFLQANARIFQKRILNATERQPHQSLFAKQEIEELENIAQGFIEGSQRISDVVQSLHTYARVDQEGIQAYEVRENIEATLKLFQYQLAHLIDLTLHFDGAESLQANPGKINQVFANLLSNAIHAVNQNDSDSPKTIRVSTKTISEQDAHIFCLSVEDNGPGLKAEDKSKIFDPFFTTKEPGEGLGLGLSISRSIIEDHNGSIHVNTSPQGTVFTIQLPLNTPTEREPTATTS